MPGLIQPLGPVALIRSDKEGIPNGPRFVNEVYLGTRGGLTSSTTRADPEGELLSQRDCLPGV